MHATRPLPEDATVRYVIDAHASTFVVQAFATGLLSSFGHSPRIGVRKFQGEAGFTPVGTALEGARLTIRVQADSLEVLDDVSEKDRAEIQRRLREEVLESDRYPEIVYECSQVSASGSGGRYWVALNGELTLHGMSVPLPVSARLVVDEHTIRATGEFIVRQSDYDIGAVTAVGGTIKVKDGVKCTFDIVARVP